MTGKSKILRHTLTFIRWLYGLLFLLVGAHALLVAAGLLPKTEYPSSPEAEEFTRALFSSGWVGLLMSITYFVSGLLIIIKRTAPLGLVLLAPFIVGIFFTNVMMNGNLASAFTMTGLWFLFAFQFYKAYQPMWNYRES